MIELVIELDMIKHITVVLDTVMLDASPQHLLFTFMVIFSYKQQRMFGRRVDLSYDIAS